MKKSNLLATAFAAVALSPFATGATVRVTHPTTEGLVNPVGLETSTPRLSWRLASDKNDVRQTSYRILVASTPGNLAKGLGDLWDSGSVATDQSLYIPYKGKPLGSRQQAFWKVNVVTNVGDAGWSEAATWRMGLTNDDDWIAQWIGVEDSPSDQWTACTRMPARYLRKEFKASKPVKKATLYISGLGIYDPWVNGKRIGEAEHAPDHTNYNKRVHYNILDVTDQVRQGDNAIGVALGNGFFSTIRNTKDPVFPSLGSSPLIHFGMPKLLAQMEIEYTDGTKETVATDPTWKLTVDGPIRANSYYDGEDYDATMELEDWTLPGYDDSAWMDAKRISNPGGRMTAEINPPITINKRLRPVSIKKTPRGTWQIDMGQNMVGWLQLTFDATKGDTIVTRHAESLRPDGTLYVDNLMSAVSTDKYIAGRDGKVTWRPTFTYHGFRYAEIEGLKDEPRIEDIEGQVIYDKMDDMGSFDTNVDMINRLHNNAYWGFIGNSHGMPTDCPQRDERLGWLGDRATGATSESYVLDNRALYTKWLQDIEDEQGVAGDLPDVAPGTWVVRSDNMTWCGAYLMIADMIYDIYGDDGPIVKHYPSMKKWMQYMKRKHGRDGLIVKDRYGDWCMPPESPELIHSKDPKRLTDGAVISTAFYYDLAGRMKKFALITGNTADTAYWEAEAQEAKKAFNDNFFNAAEGCYSNNTITANLLPLRFGMVPEGQEQRVFQNIVDKTVNDWDGHVSCGVIGIQHLMRGLTDYGRGDLALKLTSIDTYPSWGYMVKNGATTFWELWNGDTGDPRMNSGNHIMLVGDLLIWYYDYLGGIANAPGSQGYKTVLMRPHLIDGIDHATARHTSPYGDIESAWRLKGKNLLWDIAILANSSALVNVPLKGGRLSAKTNKDVERAGGRYLDTRDGYAVYAFPSGNYHLDIPVK